MGQRLEDIRRLRERMATTRLSALETQQERMRVKRRMLGVLLRDARLAAGRTEVEAAELLRLPVDVYQGFESGAEAPTLPQLEVLAYLYRVPISHFWGSEAVETKRRLHGLRDDLPALLELRNRILGVRLRQLREEAGLTVAEAAEEVGIEARALREAERGLAALAVGDTEALATLYHARLGDLVEGHGPVGGWLQAQHDFERLAELPADLRAFVLKPINRSYLDLALRLSETDVERLRGIAESILEITL